MTNTTTAQDKLAFALTMAEAVYKKALAELATSTTDVAYFDAAYFTAWRMENLVQAQFAVDALTVAVENGFDALTAYLANALRSPLSSGDAFALAASRARRDAARELVTAWRPFLNADLFLQNA